MTSDLKIDIADVNFPLPIQVLYSAEHNTVLGARLMVSANEGVDLHPLLEQDDWDHLVSLLQTTGYLTAPDENISD
jgi:hypothetical protein